MQRNSKKYTEALKLIDKNKKYNLKDAINLMKNTSIAKFDATVNLSVHLSSKLKNQLIKGNVSLPHGNGKQVKVLVITNSKIDNVKEIGADFIGGKEMINKIVNEKWFDYDVVVATPDIMVEVGKIGHILGPKGLMPNPKNGTITTDIKKTVNEIKSGKISFCSDKDCNINIGFAKISFNNDKIEENFKSVFGSIIKNKPINLKGNYINSIFINATMSPSIRLEMN